MSNSNYLNYSLDSGNLNKEDGVYPSYFNHQRWVKDTFKRLIQGLLQDPKSYKFYPQSTDYSKIFVTISNPYESADFPTIVIDSLPGTDVISDFQNFVQDLYDDWGNTIGERYGGIIESNLQIMIYAKSTMERDELADLINLGAFHVRRKALESQGIVIMQVGIENESEEILGTDKIYSVTIGAKLYSHWYIDSIYENIESIREDIITTGPENPQGPIPDPGIPVVVILDPGYIRDPLIGFSSASDHINDFLFTPTRCCGICGLNFPLRENTGPDVKSHIWAAAFSEPFCNCGGREPFLFFESNQTQ